MAVAVRGEPGPRKQRVGQAVDVGDDEGPHRRVAREAPAMIVRGVLERSPEGVVNLLADRLEALFIAPKVTSRDFQ